MKLLEQISDPIVLRNIAQWDYLLGVLLGR